MPIALLPMRYSNRYQDSARPITGEKPCRDAAGAGVITAVTGRKYRSVTCVFYLLLVGREGRS